MGHKEQFLLKKNYTLKETSQFLSPSPITVDLGWVRYTLVDCSHFDWIDGKWHTRTKLYFEAQKIIFFTFVHPQESATTVFSLTWLCMTLWVCADSYTKARRRFCYRETGLYLWRKAFHTIFKTLLHYQIVKCNQKKGFCQRAVYRLKATG